MFGGGKGPFQVVAFSLQVIPYNIMIFGIADNLNGLVDPVGHAVALFARCFFQGNGCIPEHLGLPPTVGTGFGVIDFQLMPDNANVRQVVPLIGVSEVGRLGDKDGPCRNPKPKFLFLVRIQGQVVGLRAVSLKESGKSLPGVHDPQKAGVVDQLFVSVRGRRSRTNKSVWNNLEDLQEGLIGLRSVSPQHARLIERSKGEKGRIDPAVADALVIGNKKRGC